jgi:glutathione S-transferase
MPVCDQRPDGWCGAELTLADLHAAHVRLFALALEAEAARRRAAPHRAWWVDMMRRPAMQATAYPA